MRRRRSRSADHIGRQQQQQKSKSKGAKSKRNLNYYSDDDADDDYYRKKSSAGKNNGKSSSKRGGGYGSDTPYSDDDDDGYGYNDYSRQDRASRNGGGGHGGDDRSIATSNTTSSAPAGFLKRLGRKTSSGHGANDNNGDNNNYGYNDYSRADVTEVEKLAQKRGSNQCDEKFKVLPDEAYPNMYLTRSELRQEMNHKSDYFHDLRLPTKKGSEIGQLRLEILQCFGLPDYFARDTPNFPGVGALQTKNTGGVAAYAIAVCGSHAFKTDVMPPVANPMWLCKMRRACLFPIHHAYARLFVGIFDNHESATEAYETTDFLGRVVIDIARLRPGCSYDFTLPLRQSGHVYTKQQHGSVRLRLHLIWGSERNAIMSYIPKGKPKFQPNESQTVACLDEQSFRNVAHVVHGTHMPGKFSMDLLKATVREVNFTRIHVMRYLRKREFYYLVYWQYPFISAFVFLAWMHCVYYNTVRYVPGHIVTFLLLHLYKNYAYYGMDSKLTNGFMPPTFEELTFALLKGTRKRKYIEPLNMEMEESHAVRPETLGDSNQNSGDPNNPEQQKKELKDIAKDMKNNIKVTTHKYRLRTYPNSFVGDEAVDFLVKRGYAFTRAEAVRLGRKLARDFKLFSPVTGGTKVLFEDTDTYYYFENVDAQQYVIKGHRPYGKAFMKMIGFLKENEIKEDEHHVEFPFSTGEVHSRFTVKESLVTSTTPEMKKKFKEEQTAQEIADCAEFGVIPHDPERANMAGDIAKAGKGVVTGAVGVGLDVARVGVGVVAGVGGALGGAVGGAVAGVGGAAINTVRRASLMGGMAMGGGMASPAAAAPPPPTPPPRVDNSDSDASDDENASPNKAGGVPARSSLLGNMGMGNMMAERRRTMEFSGPGDPDEVYDKLKARQNETLDKLIEEQQKANVHDQYLYDSDDDVDQIIKQKRKGVIIEEKILKKPPIQDIQKKGPKGEKSFAKIIQEARHKAHGLFLHVFNMHTYTIDETQFPPKLVDENADRDSVAKSKKDKKKGLKGALKFGGRNKEAKKLAEEEEEEKKKKKKDLVTPYDKRKDEYDKVLGINKYSHRDPWMNRVGIIIQPMLEIVQSWLFACRSLFNIFIWADPILSFWVAFIGPIVVLVLHFMPYRILFAIAGVALVGPQNYVMRLFRESRSDYRPPDFDTIVRKKKPERPETMETQFFSSQAPGNQTIKYINVEPKQIRKVVVPYGQLKYSNRFYDWPPEPQYCRVMACPPPRNNLHSHPQGNSDSDMSAEDQNYTYDPATAKKRGKKKKKGVKKLASQVVKGTGTVVVVGGELAKRTSNVGLGAVKGTANVGKNAVMGTANLSKNVAKSAVKGTAKVTKSAVKGTIKGTKKSVGLFGRRRRKGGEYDDDDSY